MLQMWDNSWREARITSSCFSCKQQLWAALCNCWLTAAGHCTAGDPDLWPLMKNTNARAKEGTVERFILLKNAKSSSSLSFIFCLHCLYFFSNISFPSCANSAVSLITIWFLFLILKMTNLLSFLFCPLYSFPSSFPAEMFLIFSSCCSGSPHSDVAGWFDIYCNIWPVFLNL